MDVHFGWAEINSHDWNESMCERSYCAGTSAAADSECSSMHAPVLFVRSWVLLYVHLFTMQQRASATPLLRYSSCTLMTFILVGRGINRNARQSLKTLPPLRLYWSECRALQGRYYHQMNGDAGWWWCWGGGVREQSEEAQGAAIAAQVRLQGLKATATRHPWERRDEIEARQVLLVFLGTLSDLLSTRQISTRCACSLAPHSPPHLSTCFCRCSQAARVHYRGTEDQANRSFTSQRDVLVAKMLLSGLHHCCGMDVTKGESGKRKRSLRALW